MNKALIPTYLIFLLGLFGLHAKTPELFLDRATPLMRAAAIADLAKMQVLLKAGANPNAVWGRDFPHAGRPVLRYAIDSQSVPAVELLLGHGANVNEMTESPLLIADHSILNVRNLNLLSHAINSYAPINIILTLLQDPEIDPNKSNSGWTPLMIAAYRGYLQAVVALLSAGADCKTQNPKDGKLAVDYAEERGHSLIAKILGDAASENSATQNPV